MCFDNKRSQARFLLDLLREQKQSDKFFDDKIDYLLGISDKTLQKVNDKNYKFLFIKHYSKRFQIYSK